MKSAYLSHKGNVRELNEDSVYAGELADKAFLALVADGMGGYNAGEIASRMAVDEVRQCLPSLDGKVLRKVSGRQTKKYLIWRSASRNTGIWALPWPAALSRKICSMPQTSATAEFT